MFRRGGIIPKTDLTSASLRIASCLYHLVYLNGELVDRGLARTYNFSKGYNVIDVTAYFQPGQENVLAVLAPEIKQQDTPKALAPTQGLLADLVLHSAGGHDTIISTDRSWKVLRHPSLQAGMPEAIPLRGPEESFDARQEPLGWKLAGFDDRGWSAAKEIGPVGTPPWITMEQIHVSRLSNDSKYPVRLSAIELAAPRAGLHRRLGSPFQGAKLFATEVTAPRECEVRLHVVTGRPLVSLDGKTMDPAHTIPFSAGTHLLALTEHGDDLEFFLETATTVQLSASRILPSGEAEWAVVRVPSNDSASADDYPWEGSPWEDQRDDTPVPTLTADLRTRLQPAVSKPPGIMHQVTTQEFYKVAGGFTHPAVERGQPRLSAGASFHNPVLNPHNLLHANGDGCTVVPQVGKDVHIIVDFDREFVGYLRLQLDAPAGTVVDVQCFELVDGGGIAWMDNRNGFRYVCREGTQEFTSHYRRGFRYVSLTLRNFSRPVLMRSVTCYHSAYPVQEIGGFECSDPLLNTVHRMCLDTAALCMLETYVDCPGHEQNVWVGDARITSLINLTTFGAMDLNQRFLRLVGQSTRPEWVKEYWPNDARYLDRRYLPIAAFPNYPEGCLPMWSFLWMMQCWEHYLYGGDKTDLAENFGYITATLENCRRLTNERGLFDVPGAWNLIEWGNNDLSAYGEVTANNVLLVRCLRSAARMATELGRANDATTFESEATRRTDAINALCWDHARNAYVDTVRDRWAYDRYVVWSRSLGHTPVSWRKYAGYARISEQTNTLALISDCVPADRQAAVTGIVKRVGNGRYVAGSPAGRTSGAPPDNEAPDGIVAIGSPFFLFFSLEALYRLGLSDTALNVMRRDWGAMAAHGTRTCWETFKNDERHWTRSVCHAWSASPAFYLPSEVLGVRPVAPGFRKFSIAPHLGDLSWARGSVHTPHGPIFVEWRRKPTGEIDLTWTAPAECQRV